MLKLPSNPRSTRIEFTDRDKNIIQLKRCLTKIENSMSEKQRESDNLTGVIQKCLRDGKRPMAKMHLRRKKRIENALSKHIGMADNLVW